MIEFFFVSIKNAWTFTRFFFCFWCWKISIYFTKSNIDHRILFFFRFSLLLTQNDTQWCIRKSYITKDIVYQNFCSIRLMKFYFLKIYFLNVFLFFNSKTIEFFYELYWLMVSNWWRKCDGVFRYKCHYQ